MARTHGATTRQGEPNTIREKLWRVMQINPKFTTYTLEAHTQADYVNVRKYLQSLVRAGYVRIIAERRSGQRGGHAVYKLARNTGPLPPIRRRGGDGMFDQNEQKFYPYARQQEAA